MKRFLVIAVLLAAAGLFVSSGVLARQRDRVELDHILIFETKRPSNWLNGRSSVKNEDLRAVVEHAVRYGLIDEVRRIYHHPALTGEQRHWLWLLYLQHGPQVGGGR
jgi:hypothetical protein